MSLFSFSRRSRRPAYSQLDRRRRSFRPAVELLEARVVPSWATVGPNVNVTRATGNQAETTIAINPTNTLNLFASDTWANKVRYSTDGGATWQNSNVSAIPASIGDVQAAWDQFGNLFFTRINTSGTIEVARSSDGGATFKDPRTIANSSGGDQPSIAVGPSGVAGVAGSVWVSFTNGSNQLVAAGAPVNGFDSVGAFNAPEVAPGPGGDFGGIAIGPAGQVMVTYQDNGSGVGPDTIKINVDPDGLGPQRFNSVVIPTTTNVGGFAPIPAQPNRTTDAEANLAWDRSGGPHNGRVYLEYVDRPNTSSADEDVFVRFSDDNGTTWSNRVRVNDDALGNGKSQFNPAIAVDQTSGFVAVTWYDTRNSGTANNTTQMFGTVSLDGGLTFLPNVQISAGTSNATLTGTGFDFGDYDTMDFTGGVFYRSWGDNSNSTGDNPNGALHGLNLYTAKVIVGDFISGTVFNDLDGDGGIRQADEPGLGGWTVYLDLHNSGMLEPDDPTAVTSPTGGYVFNGLDPGTYIVREVRKDGWIQTAPDSGSYTVTIVDSSTIVTDQDFGNTLINPSSISGVLFHDLHASGIPEPGDPPLAGWTVFLDANNTGVFVPGDRFAVTGADGSYTIAGLEPGTYIVRELPMNGWVQSAPSAPPFYTVPLGAGDTATGIDFGAYHPVILSGQVFHDLNGNGVKDPGEPGLAGWTVFVDAAGTGVFDPSDPHAVTDAQGNYSIPNVKPGTVVLGEVVQPNWVSTNPESGFYTLDVLSDANQTGLDFGNESGTITGQVFQDTTGNGIKGTSAGLANWRVYLDLHNSGVFDPSDPNTLTDAQGNYIFGGLAAGTYTVREVVQTGWVQTTPAAGYFTVTIDGPSTTVTGRDFGDFKLVTISGTKYNDVNGSGRRDAGDPGLAGWIIYDDLNNSGTFLPGDPFAVSGPGGSYSLTAVGPGTHHIREFLFPGWIQGAPADGYTIRTASGQNISGRDFGDRLVNPASISGLVFHDLNGDGMPEDKPGLAGWTVSLDANSNGSGQQSIVTDAQGHFTLAGLMPGTYTVRETLQTSWRASVPASGFFTVTVSAGQNVPGLAFGNYLPVSISGHVVNDANGAPLRGWTVYDDVNNNGMLDQGTVTFDPDNYTNNQVLNHAFPGVTLSYLGNNTNSVIALPTPPGSAGGARVFGSTDLDFGPEFYSGGNYELRIDFATPVSAVTIDAIGTSQFSGLAKGLLKIFNAANTQIGSVTSPNFLNGGQLATLTLTRPTADIAYVLASSDSFFYGVLLDNLRVGPLPTEPFAVTAADGSYTITGLKPGEHFIREVPQPGWTLITPADGVYDVALVSGQNQTGLDFRNVQDMGPGGFGRQLLPEQAFALPQSVRIRHLFEDPADSDGW